jgi:hypothetical protein
MNGLRGIDVDVIQIGSTTRGKPYGFFPQDNCGTTYFSIQFQGVNGLLANGRELGMPERFRLVKSGGQCVLVHERSGKRFALAATNCAPIPS